MEKINADGLILSPIIGEKKVGDFSNEFLMESYMELMKTNVYGNKALLIFLDIYPRYAGPREAIFTAQCRKNLGCTHFIVGRDHSGLSNFYNNTDSLKFFKKIEQIGIELIFFEMIGYDKRKKKYGFCNGKMETISGTFIRNCIKNKKRIPQYLLNKSQHNLISKWKKNFFC